MSATQQLTRAGHQTTTEHGERHVVEITIDDTPTARPAVVPPSHDRPRRRRARTVAVASLLAVGGVSIAAMIAPSEDRSRGEPSILQDGPAFDLAVDRTVGEATTHQPSVLLDGRAFEQAIERAVVSIDDDINDIDDDGGAFQRAIDRTVGDLASSDIDDGGAFQRAVDRAVAALQE